MRERVDRQKQMTQKMCRGEGMERAVRVVVVGGWCGGVGVSWGCGQGVIGLESPSELLSSRA